MYDLQIPRSNCGLQIRNVLLLERKDCTTKPVHVMLPYEPTASPKTDAIPVLPSTATTYVKAPFQRCSPALLDQVSICEDANANAISDVETRCRNTARHVRLESPRSSQLKVSTARQLPLQSEEDCEYIYTSTLNQPTNQNDNKIL